MPEPGMGASNSSRGGSPSSRTRGSDNSNSSPSSSETKAESIASSPTTEERLSGQASDSKSSSDSKSESKEKLESNSNSGQTTRASASRIDTSSLSGIEAASNMPTTGDKEARSPVGAITAAAAQDFAHRSPGPIAGQVHVPGRVEAQAFRTADAAAFNALEKSNSASIRSNLEIGGLIYEKLETKKFHATEPVLGSEDGVELDRVSAPEDSRIVGDYHTHADYSIEEGNIEDGNRVVTRTTDSANDGFNSDRFSLQDFQGNKFEQIAGYLGTPGGEFRKVEPDMISDNVFSVDTEFDPDSVRDSKMSVPLETTKTNGRNGAAIGGAVEAVIATYNSLQDGYQHSDLSTIADAGGKGAIAGSLTAVGEHYAERGIESRVGSAVQKSVGEVAVRSGFDDVAVGTAARTIASRTGGAGAVGAVIGAGFSVYENREGLGKGDSEAIGDVAGDTVVAAGSAIAGAAAGAAIGSAVPVLGTVVGAAVGLGVGFGVDYVARKGGIDEVVGNVVSGGVDLAKSAGKKVASLFGW